MPVAPIDKLDMSEEAAAKRHEESPGYLSCVCSRIGPWENYARISRTIEDTSDTYMILQ